MKIKTFEEAAEWIEKVKVCTIFGSDKTMLPSLWDQVDLPEKKKGEKGWGEKVSAVWSWKNRLPAEFPEDIFYGKVKGGFAVLMAMDYLRDVHFEKAYKSVDELSLLAQTIHEKIRIEPWATGQLRKEVRQIGCSKSQFDTALKSLQVTLNIVRLNDLKQENDTWVVFREQYPEIWDLHHGEDYGFI